VSRPAFSDSDIRDGITFIGLMKESGLEVRTDPREYHRPEGRKRQRCSAIAIGSHLDTVPNGGKYDGALGVIAALECVQALEEGGFEPAIRSRSLFSSTRKAGSSEAGV